MTNNSSEDDQDFCELLSAEHLCLKAPLYQKFKFDPQETDALSSIEFFEGTIDCYCHGCERHSVLACHKSKFSTQYFYTNHLFRLVFRCTRDESHLTTFLFRADSGHVEKIGQFPSLSDLASPDLQKYRPVLSDERYRELIRGVGLASHDVGIGAFVYLRRVFETLIHAAHVKAKDDAGWDETAYEKARMDERIQLLRNSLPPFLVENRVLYKILSSGVHELSEQECLKAFPAVKLGIELILDDELERHRREKKLEEARKELHLTAQGIKQPKTS